jgi:hypothetical protein
MIIISTLRQIGENICYLLKKNEEGHSWGFSKSANKVCHANSNNLTSFLFSSKYKSRDSLFKMPGMHL